VQHDGGDRRSLVARPLATFLAERFSSPHRIRKFACVPPAAVTLIDDRSVYLLHGRMSHVQNGTPLLYLPNLGHYLSAPYRGKR